MGIFLIINLARSENTDIVINEICPTGCAVSGHQWIEIYNKGDVAVDLSGWKFWEGETNHGLDISSSSLEQDFLIEPGEYAIIAQNDLYFFEDHPDVTSTIFDSSWGTLNKGGELIGMKDNNGDLLEEFIYKAINNFSLERKDANELITDENNWLEHPDSNSVGQVNYWSGYTDDTGHGDTEDEEDTEDDGDTEGDDETTTSTPPIATSTDAVLVINEFVSDPDEGQNEWIELYNIGTSTIDLDGWTLSDGVGVISSPTGTIDANGFFVIELSSTKLNNSGDIIILKNLNEETVDQVCFGNWIEGCLPEATSAPDKGNSIARIVDGGDTNNDKNDWQETTTLTKGLINIITAPVVNPPPSGGGGGGGGTEIVYYNAGEIIINEINSDPGDGEDEFVELYNKTSDSISLDNWWLEDGSETKTKLSGSINARGFFVIEKPSGNLNNAGDLLALFSPDGKEIDKVSYGTWDDGNINDNAPAPEDPLSLVRKVDGQDSDNDYYDFVLTSSITKGKSNKISAVLEDGEILEQIIGSSKIILNEIFPNPKASDNDEEFIELKNIGEETVNLKDWQLSDSTARKYKITQGSIPAGGYIVFKRIMTGIALNNTGGEEIKLFLPSGSLVDSVKYSGSADDNISYAQLEDGGWKWTTKLTPGKDNIIEGKAALPIISIDVDTEVAVGESVVFDASDTTDPDGEKMTFVWNFGDGEDDTGDVVEHSFNTEGVYTVILNVTNKNGAIAEKKIIITVKNKLSFVGGYYQADDVSKIEISEILPNPIGSDTTEFVELYNPTDKDIDLGGIKIDDEEGGSRAYTIPDKTIIPAGVYLVFGRQDTKLALNNTSDSVRLLYPDGTIFKEVRFDDVSEGASYIQDENDSWQWTSAITPGEENIDTLVVEKATTRTLSKSKGIKPIINTTLEKLRDEDIGDKVRVTGVVAVEPGVLASQYFYIVGSPGVQVYMYKKDFPDLKVGDRIEISGEISESYGNTRIKLASKDDIKKIDHPGDPEPLIVEVADVQEQMEGWLVQVSGEVTEIKGSYMYVDDGTE
ncbi:MAG: lamin tail domain-containing protein, partial [Candidatus Magasanikiibacteriota bacterium]